MRHPGWKKVDALTAALSQLSCGDREVEIDPEIRAMKQKPARAVACRYNWLWID